MLSTTGHMTQESARHWAPSRLGWDDFAGSPLFWGEVPAQRGLGVGSSVSEVLAAFVASLEGMWRTHDDRAVRFQRGRWIRIDLATRAHRPPFTPFLEQSAG